MANHKVLLVWNEVPENLKLYSLPDVSDAEYDKLKLCSGHMVNQVDQEKCVKGALRWLSVQIGEDGPWCGKKSYDDSCDTLGLLMIEGIWTVIVSGFLM